MNGSTLYRIEIKAKARELLARNFLKTALAVVAYVLLGLLLSYLGEQVAGRVIDRDFVTYMAVTVSFSILSMILSSPVIMGVYGYCVKLVDGGEPSGWDVFQWIGEFSKLWRSAVLSFCYMLYCTFWFAVYLALPVLMLSYFNVESGFLLWIQALVAVVCIVAAILHVNIYQVAFILLAEDPAKGPIRCLREAGKIMKPYRWDFFILSASFLPWMLIASVTFGMLLIYVYPYQYLSQILFYRDCLLLKGEKPIMRFEEGRRLRVSGLPWTDPAEEGPEAGGDRRPWPGGPPWPGMPEETPEERPERAPDNGGEPPSPEDGEKP